MKEELRVPILRLLNVLTDEPEKQNLIKFWITQQPVVEIFQELAMSKDNIEMTQLASLLLNKMRYCTIK